MSRAKDYDGQEKIVFSIDVGTTHSAVSYSYLYPGSPPDIKMVTKWAGQPEAMGDSKIPTILAYQNGTLVACGAEAREFIGDDQYEIARWFKLYLHPESMRLSDLPPPYVPLDEDPIAQASIEIPPMPTNVSLQRLYTDFLNYLFKAARRFFEANTPNGSQILTRLNKAIIIILTTPNGWDIAQQGFLRQSAIEADLVSNENAETQLEFVTEGEASVHYTLSHHTHSWLRQGSQFVVVDAGGSTVDSTLYECKAIEPKLILHEGCRSECVQAGGTFVDDAARELLKKKLEDSAFSDNEYIDTMLEIFERNTKRVFDGSQESSVLHFGRSRDNDRARNIIGGRLSLTRDEVITIFGDVVQRIAGSISRLIGNRRVPHILLVGGFGESPYLRNRLRELLGQSQAEIITVDEPSKKAAAEGASIWYIKQLVAERVARFTIGKGITIGYQSHLPDHHARRHLRTTGPDGFIGIPGAFSIWIEKGTSIDQNFSQTFGYYRCFKDRPTPRQLSKTKSSIYVWEGQEDTKWVKSTDGTTLPGMRRLCSLQLSGDDIDGVVQRRISRDGVTTWIVRYRVSVRIGGTQLHARIQWEENGIIHEGPVKIIPGSAF